MAQQDVDEAPATLASIEGPLVNRAVCRTASGSRPLLSGTTRRWFAAVAKLVRTRSPFGIATPDDPLVLSESVPERVGQFDTHPSVNLSADIERGDLPLPRFLYEVNGNIVAGIVFIQEFALQSFLVVLPATIIPSRI